MIYIYTMIDPRTGNPFYVGQSIHPQHRLNQHITTRFRALPGHVGLTPTQLLIREICDAGLEPSIKVVEEVSSFLEARLSEDYWMRTLTEQGHKLTNIMPGVGNHGHYSEVSPSPKLNMSKYMTTKEAARYLSVTEGRIRQMVSQGVIRAGKIGNNNMIPVAELDAYNMQNQGGGRRSQ